MSGNAIDQTESWGLLTLSDRCDACGARAVGRALLPTSERAGDGLLLLCGHHLRQHGPAFREAGGLLVIRPPDAVAAWLPAQPHDAGDGPASDSDVSEGTSGRDRPKTDPGTAGSSGTGSSDAGSSEPDHQ